MLDILTILGSLILCIGVLDAIPAMGKHLERFAKWLGAFQTLIGLIIIILVAVFAIRESRKLRYLNFPIR